MADMNNTTRREPLLRMAKRDDMPAWQAWAIRITSIFVALLLGGGLVMITGYNPFSVYAAMLNGCFGTPLALQQTIKLAIPLLGAAVAIAPASQISLFLDFIGSLIVACYLIWCSLRTIRETRYSPGTP